MKMTKVLAVTALLLSLSFAILVGGTLPYFVFYVVFLSFLIPLIHSLLSLRKIKGSINLPQGAVYKDENIDINFLIDNKGFLPIPYLEIENEISKQLTRKNPKKTIISLEKNDSYSKRESIRLNRRGFYTIVAIKVRIRDVLGLYSFKKAISSPASLLVYPQPIDLSHFSGISSQRIGELSVKDSTSKNRNNIKSFREYKPGDSINSIHWKLTSKLDIPIIKEYERSGDTNVLILLDNSRHNFSNDIDRRLEDKSVDLALSLVNYCLRENIPLILDTQNKAENISLEGQEQSDLKPFLEVFARLESNGHHEFKYLIQGKTENLRKTTTLIVISPVLDKEIGARLLDIKLRGINLIFILLTDRENKSHEIDLNVEKRLYQEAIMIYMIDYKTSIKEVLEAYHE